MKPDGRLARLLFHGIALLVIAESFAVFSMPEAGKARSASESRLPSGLNAGLVTSPAPGSTFSDCKDGCPSMVVVQAGQFLMGSAQYSREQPQHTVKIVAQFAVSEFDITLDEWAACAEGGGCSGNKTPSDEGWGRGRRPVINVSWIDAHDYVSWLSKKTGETYRLLTEAEWEYVARAGSTTSYPWGNAIDCEKASYDGGPGSKCSSKTFGGQRLRGTQPVGRYAPNGWGLYDAIGNVWQWCEDSWHPDYRGAPVDGTAWQGGDESMAVLRGGAWNYGPSGLRTADRNWLPRSARTDFLGFRVARPLEAKIATLQPAFGAGSNVSHLVESQR